MFTSQQRERLRRQLLGRAGEDPRITAAAVTGSAADGLQDRWSDIDLFLGIRDQTLALASLRLGQPTGYAKGADALPVEVIEGLEDALVRSLAPAELRRALRVAATRLLGELDATDPIQAQRLGGPIGELADLAGIQPRESAR